MLENLPIEERETKLYWTMRCRIFEKAEQWVALEDVSRHLVQLDPHHARGWLWAAKSAAMTKDRGAATMVLILALSFLNDDPQIRYELDCLCCELNHLQEAKEHLRVAILGDCQLKMWALEEERLEGIW